MSSSDSVRLRANAAYGELNGKNPYEGLSLSGKISNSSKDDPNINVFKVVRITLSAVVATTGVILAVSGNSMAKKASEKGASSEDGFQKNIDDAKTGQTLRGVGIGLAIAGGIGLGLSIAF